MPFEQELIAAVRANRPEDVRQFLGMGANATTIIEKEDDVLDAKMSVVFPMSVLLYAIKLGYDEVANAILEYKPDINQGNINGYTPLMAAADAGKRNWVQRLIELGADLDLAHKKSGGKLIFYAAEGELLDVIELCIERGQSPSQGDNNGLTPVHVAAKTGHLSAVRYLIEKCAADPDKATDEGFRPLFLAAKEGHFPVVEYLVEKCKVDINRDDNKATNTALSLASEKGYTDIVRYLLSKGSLVDKGQRSTEKSPLWFACENGHFDVAKELIARGANIDLADTDDWTPLHIATSISFISIMGLLLSNGADIEAWTEKRKSTSEIKGGHTPFLLACSNSHPEAVHFLLEGGADPLVVNIKEGWSALTLAVPSKDQVTKDSSILQRSEKVIDMLLTRTTIDPNYMPNDTRYMSTAFRFAVLHGFINLVKRLLNERRVDVNQDFHFGHFALYLAAEAGHEEIINLLLADNRINTSMKNYKGETALYIAEQKGHTKIAALLRAASVDTDPPLCRAARKGNMAEMMRLVKADRRCFGKTTDSGETALYIACHAHQLEAVRFLLGQKETDPRAVTQQGYFPLYIAAEKGFDDIILALLTNVDTDVNQMNRHSGDQTSLYTAVRNGKTEAVRALLTSPKINVNQANRSDGWDGWGPINQAASQGHVEVVRLLLGHKDIDPNIRSAEWTGYISALTTAAQHERMEIVVALLIILVLMLIFRQETVTLL